MPLHEQGFIANCSLCDSYFVLTTSLFQPSLHRGRDGKKSLDNRNEKLQRQWEAKRWALLRCPTCVEISSDMKFLDWIEKHARSLQLLTPLSPCWIVSFEDDQPPPLFFDEKPAGEPGKPKWRLASGVGPAGLELDSSRSGRLWKPSLRAAGIDRPRYAAVADADAAYHAGLMQRVETALVALGEHADVFAEEIHLNRPAFEPARFAAVAHGVDAACEQHAAAAAEAEREERQRWSEKRHKQESSLEGTRRAFEPVELS